MGILNRTGGARPITRRALLTASGLAAGTLVVGCGGKTLGGTSSGGAGSGTGELQFWLNHTADEQKQFQLRADAFHEKNPDITIKILNIANGTDYYTKINTAAVGGAMPDVFYARSVDTAPNAYKDWALQLDDLLARDKAEINPDDFWKPHVAQMSYEGHLYGLPYDFSDCALYYNKTMFEKEGVALPTDDWTWSDLYDNAAHFVQKKGKTQQRWGVSTQMSAWVAMGYFKANGGDTFSDDLKTCVINNDANVQTFTEMATQRAAGVVPATGATPQGVDAFGSQLLAMKIDGTWATQTTRDAVDNKFEWDVVKLPKGTSGGRAVSTAGGQWTIAKTSPNQEAAWTWIKFLSSPESEKALIVDQLRGVPGRQSLVSEMEQAATAGKKSPANVAAFPEQMGDDAENWSYPVFFTEFNTSWTNHIATLGISGDPAKMLQQIQDETNKAAAKY